MYILGIHGNFGKAEHDSAAVLIQDNRIIAAAEEERFVRYKHAVGLMPDRAIRFCLDTAGITMADIDCIAFPRSTWRDFGQRLDAYLWYNFGHTPNVVYVDHHTAHAASAYYISGFSSSFVITIDQAGDGISCAVFRAQGKDLNLLRAIPFPDSLGLFAAYITQYLGFRSNCDEYKVMGLAPYGRPNYDLSGILSIKYGEPVLNRDILHAEVLNRHPVFHTDQLPIFKNSMISTLPTRRLPSDKILREHKDLAASAQMAIEKAIFALIDHYRLDDQFLCLAGGVAENSVANGKIAMSRLFKDVYVAPACGDAGTALGAALYVAVQSGFQFSRLEDNKLGPEYTDDYIESLLRANNIKYHRSGNVSEEIANLLAQQNIVAWFQGRMEFGPRALGSRSLIADPTNLEMKERVNRIKKREQFRPFGPAVLAEYSSEFFEMEQSSPFMSFTLPTTTEGKHRLVAATHHMDSTSRLQSVPKTESPYRELIEAFADRTGVPAILNTSLNSGWEPIVESPEQALSFFFASEADVLTLHNFVIQKHE